MDPHRSNRKSSLPATLTATTCGVGMVTWSTTGSGRIWALPPLMFNSESEREAHIRNRHEQIRLHKLLDHLDVQERVFVQLINKERSVVETLLMPSTNGRGRHQKRTRQPYQRTASQDLRTRQYVTVKGNIGMKSHSSPTIVALLESGATTTLDPVVDTWNEQEKQQAEGSTSRTDSVGFTTLVDLPRSFSVPNTEQLVWISTPTHQHQVEDSYSSDNSTGSEHRPIHAGKNTASQHKHDIELPNDVLVNRLPSLPGRRSFTIGDSRSSSMESDEAVCYEPSSIKRRHQLLQQHQGPYLFRSPATIARPATAAFESVGGRLTAEMSIEPSMALETSVDDEPDMRYRKNEASGTTLRLPPPEIVIHDDNGGYEEDDDDNDHMTTLLYKRRNERYLSMSPGEKTNSEIAISDTYHNDDLTANTQSSHMTADRPGQKPPRSKSACQLTSYAAAGLRALLPPLRRSNAIDDCFVTPNTHAETSDNTRSVTKVTACDETQGDSLNKDRKGETAGREKRDKNETKRDNSPIKHNKNSLQPHILLHLPTFPNSERSEMQTPGLPTPTNTTSSKQHSSSHVKHTAAGQNMLKTSPLVQRRVSASAVTPHVVGCAEDAETKLRRELRELERQRRQRDEKTAAMKVERERAIAVEKSKYGVGLAPRIEQFISRLRRTTHQRQQERNEDECEQNGDKKGRETIND